jgi:hypothetical protein
LVSTAHATTHECDGRNGRERKEPWGRDWALSFRSSSGLLVPCKCIKKKEKEKN